MINKDSLICTIQFLQKHSDGDLLPPILEFNAIADKAELLSDQLCSTDLSKIEIGACRRFIVPKDEVSYRQATELQLGSDLHI